MNVTVTLANLHDRMVEMDERLERTRLEFLSAGHAIMADYYSTRARDARRVARIVRRAKRARGSSRDE